MTGILTTGWRPGELGSPWTLLWWAGVAFTLAGLLALFACVYPRMAPSAEHGSQHLFYFANIRDYASTDALKAALPEGAPDPLERTTHQLFHVSRIVHLKFSLIRWGIWLLGLGAAACGVAAVRPF